MVGLSFSKSSARPSTPTAAVHHGPVSGARGLVRMSDPEKPLMRSPGWPLLATYSSVVCDSEKPPTLTVPP